MSDDVFCIYCNYKFETQTCLDEKENIEPKEGDITFCLKCCEPHMFDKNKKPVKIDITKLDNETQDHILMMSNRMRKYVLKERGER